jgi:hypothetical protein
VEVRNQQCVHVAEAQVKLFQRDLRALAAVNQHDFPLAFKPAAGKPARV